MNILYLNTFNTGADGIGRHIETISTYFHHHPELGIKPGVCLVHPKGTLSDNLQKEGVSVYCLGCKNGHDPRILTRFHSVLKEFRPDVIHAHVPAIMEYAYLRLSGSKIPIVKTTHGIALENIIGNNTKTLKQRISQYITKYISPSITQEIYVSKGVKDFYHNLNGRVIYNPFTFTESNINSHKLHSIIGVPENTTIWGTACRLSREKRPELFTHVMAELLIRFPDSHAVVCGNGDVSTMKELEYIVDKANVSKRFHWLGYRPDAPELTKNLSFFIMTSLTEGMPTALLEAMAAKVPIAFMEANGGLRDLADLHRHEGPIGVVVKNSDINEMITEISSNIGNNELLKQYTENAFAIGKNHFDINNIALKLCDVYRESQKI